MKKIDLIGKEFGRLTVLSEAEPRRFKNGKSYRYFICQCNCDDKNIITTGYSHLTSGRTKSCGCLQKEIAGELGRKSKKYNTYDLSGEYGIGETSDGKKFYFDLEDYNKIKDYCWHVITIGYITTKDSKNDNKDMYLHRYIMNVLNDKNILIDHINHNPLDNRKINLRLCTHQENLFNRVSPSNNTSGEIGVSWSKRDKKWNARIICNNIQKSKDFVNYQDAVNQRIIWEQEYFGEFALNREGLC